MALGGLAVVFGVRFSGGPEEVSPIDATSIQADSTGSAGVPSRASLPPAETETAKPDLLVPSDGEAQLEAKPAEEFSPSPSLAESIPEVVAAAPTVTSAPENSAPPAELENNAPTPMQADTPLPATATPLSLAQVLPPGTPPDPAQIPPSFDLVRVSPDGSTLIAGRAEANALIQVISDGRPVAEVQASAGGEFVVFLQAPYLDISEKDIPEISPPARLVFSQDDILILPPRSDMPDATPIVLRRTPDKVQIVQPSGPAAPRNISLDLVSYSESGTVLLAGRGKPGNTARIYVDEMLAGEAIIASGGNWELEIMDIAKGRYVLRVDEINTAGEVLSRAELPFQRDFPAAQLPNSFSQGAKIIVQPGNTLWLMASEAYGDGGAYTQIFSANQDTIRDPDLIYPGQIFSIPRVEE
ncbi:MAG: LysM peptidoglycan-binding domain-containing protein [Rhodobacteraceae bacterium]|nr:LysM peptidoglycan-binding domain-containing protein [Paracoccaceae bacterium]